MYNLRDAVEGDYDFLYNLNESTMKDNVIKTWGSWDEEFQRKYFKEYAQTLRYQIITLGDQRIGAVALSKKKDILTVDEIQILPEFQDKGIGTLILKGIIADAEKSNIPVELKVLKINHLAQKLYMRLGFSIIQESDTHNFMKRESNLTPHVCP